jgi:Flp pilus assembly protein TadG
MKMLVIVKRRRNRSRGQDEGTAAVEAAFIAPILFLAILGIFEFGMALWQWNTMSLAVEQTGRYVMVNNAYSSNPPGCTGTLASCAESQMQAVLPSASVCTTPTAGQICVSASTSAGTPSRMTLTAAYNFNLLALFGPFTITSQGTVPLI